MGKFPAPLPPLQTLRAFEAASRLESFTRAARELNVTQGAVSRQIRHLEERLGVTIADRHMVARGELVQPLDIEIPGHDSYWLATRPGQPLAPEMALFANWLDNELGNHVRDPFSDLIPGNEAPRGAR